MASANDSRQPQKDAVDQNFDYMFKLLIIGNSSVGKTSFLFRYADDSFTSAFVSTVGIDFKVKTVYRNDKRVKLQIWDTAGQERYRTITTAYYRGAMGFLLTYDITNQESFNAVQDWATQIKTYSWDNAQVILVGNKSDLEDDRVIPAEEGKRLSDELAGSAPMCECLSVFVIQDTAGQERYRTITTAYYRGAMGFLLTYDITNQESFNAVQDWATQIKTYSWDNAQVILVGNKCDLEDDRVIPAEEGRRLSDELGFEFFEASAKDNINVKQVFERLVDVICEKMNESLDSDPTVMSNKTPTLNESPPPSQGGCAC
ncbi:UNVERIFIED_CONTAM: hypothetical protein FKN15_061925 [Acipenser sinensis]